LRPIWAHGSFIHADHRPAHLARVCRGSRGLQGPAGVEGGDEAKKARWTSTADVKRHYVTASVVSADRIVFNIKGNDYRLVVAVDFEKGILWIKWIGTHKDYDRIDVREVRHGS
jgi:mRNA-degrading endonuclease HigB of HigAB toxin-antitoxin module